EVPEEVLLGLVGRYGGETRAVLALADSDPTLKQPIDEGLPHLGAEVVYAVRSEMATSVDDVLSRRTRSLLRDAEAARRAAERAASLMAEELGWDADRRAAEIEAFTAVVERDLKAPRSLAHAGAPGPGSDDDTTSK
ncbi:MAG TPA: glycerol-3-phosphate dehydrogenase C-terminal domain-containing protein, partial [Acidimicrobiales bacterium]|nr:glycerol-3-phosphate dehydrogenase C-terminal domain-containing protein [Acidimicrobiales bacterium]